MEESLLQAANSQLIDCEGEQHTLSIAPGELIMLNGQPYTLDVNQQTNEITFFGNQGVIRCQAKALWEALAGEGSRPTAEEAGLFIAEGLLLSERLRQWRQALEVLNRQTLSLLEQELPRLPLPHARLDPFTEELLDRCPDLVTPEHLHTLVCLLGRSEHHIQMWLEYRGKSVAWWPAIPMEPAPTPVQEISRKEQKELPSIEPEPIEPEQKTEEKRQVFRWTAVRIAQLKAAYRRQVYHSPEQTLDARAQAIAGRYDWPWKSVRYKIMQLHLSSMHQKPEARQEVVTLAPGSFLWDAKVDGVLQRWTLDYPYGQCPFEQGTLCTYQEQTYRLEYVNNSQLVATKVQPPAELSGQADVQERPLVELETSA